ncbi:MAG: hypothetical protein JNN06_13900 [Gemmobacter sp.]|uniref:hypothetical protein n=1 Tax=Gemmobacter sp. TaxID=1898957 RepID=UPI001A59BE58|nr:hypothetical protein [Gemmobacter sp.]MBL8563366.1 hypothetical protein [Gemmobacter sp.]
MSNPDSFIDEVTEEVRRDKLFAAFKKYGWIGGLVVAVVVGGTAWTEWRKSTEAAQAQAFGDAVFAATEAPDAAARRAALAAVPATGERAAVLNLLLASDPSDDRAATIAALQKVEADATLPQVWRDLAVLRRVSLQGADLALTERRGLLEPIAQPGRTFRPLAAEQLAYLLVEEGKTPEAITALQALTEDQEAPAGLRSRAGQMIVALGGTPKQG